MKCCIIHFKWCIVNDADERYMRSYKAEHDFQYYLFHFNTNGFQMCHISSTHTSRDTVSASSWLSSNITNKKKVVMMKGESLIA